MDKVLRIAAVAAGLLGLSGCNLVVSKEPWFAAADAVPMPPLRDGLWVNVAADCRFDEAKPAERWPDCADASFVRGEESWSMRWDDADERGRHRRTFAGWESADPYRGGLIVANGDHLIAQVETGDEPEERPSGEGDQETRDAEGQGYMYFAIRPVRYDEASKVTALELWSIQCGPLPEPIQPARRKKRSGDDATEEASPSVTDKPFPGLTVIDNDCIAENVEALRRAAVLSEALGDRGRSHWVRDGWH